jgi:hypothetical protein
MIKKGFCLMAVVCFLSCSSSKSTGVKPLYEVLNTNNDGGANIRFYEILTEPNEIKMLMSDQTLRHKIKSEDLEKSNFIILNMGELPEGNYSVEITKVEETATNIILHVKETKPKRLNANPDGVVVYPYSVVKINSKKPILIQ